MTLTMDHSEQYDTTSGAADNGAPNNTTVTVTTDNGLLDDTSIGYLTALSTLTGRSTKDLGREAIEVLKQSLVPTTKPRAAVASSSVGAGRRGRKPAEG